MPIKVISIGSDRSLFVSSSATRERARAYAKRVGELHIVVFSRRSHPLQEVHEGPLHIYPTNSTSRLWYVFDAARIVKRLSGDVITTQDPFEAGLSGLFGRRGRPLHVQMHTDPYAAEFKKSLLNRLRLLIARVVLPRAQRVRTVSTRVATLVRERYPRLSVSVLPIFVDIRRFASLPRAKHPRFQTTLLWIGRFEREKNPSLAIKALAALREKKPEAGLVMLGKGSLGEALRALAKECGVEEWVEFPGWQDPRHYLAMADLVLATSRYEGYGMATVEALAAGVPVLSTDVGVAREAGAIVTSEKDFTDALVQWVQGGPRTATLANYPYKDFEEYIENYCADIEAAIKK